MQLTVGKMTYNEAKRKGVVDKYFTSVKEVFSKSSSQVNRTYYMADGSGLPIYSALLKMTVKNGALL